MEQRVITGELADRAIDGKMRRLVEREGNAAAFALRKERKEHAFHQPLPFIAGQGRHAGDHHRGQNDSAHAKLHHAAVERWSASAGAVLLCGRYEGIDQRFVDRFVDVQISLGDFVLSGGELAAMALIDAVARLQPGVLGDENSHVQDSFNPAVDGLLDCPHFTRPEHWREACVPTVLLSGHHGEVAKWRRAQAEERTRSRRPDLLA